MRPACPGFFCIQDLAEYRLTHHSQSDTFDKVWKDDLNQGAEVLGGVGLQHRAAARHASAAAASLQSGSETRRKRNAEVRPD